MRLLLDSHTLFWWDADLSRLSKAQKDAIGEGINEVFVSPVTAWELGIKAAAGQLILSEPITAMIRRFGFRELPITLAHAVSAASLPQIHKDPFDRMLVAQAMVEGMILVTMDRRIREYDVAVL